MKLNITSKGYQVVFYKPLGIFYGKQTIYPNKLSCENNHNDI